MGNPSCPQSPHPMPMCGQTESTGSVGHSLLPGVAPSLSPGPSHAQWSSPPPQPAQGRGAGASQKSQALGRTLHGLEHQSPTCPLELDSKATFRRSLLDSPRTTKAPLLHGSYRETLLISHSAGFNYHVCLSG